MGKWIWRSYYCNMENTWIEVSDHKNNPSWPSDPEQTVPDSIWKNYPIYDALELCSEPEDTFPPLATVSMKRELNYEETYSILGAEIKKKYRWAYLPKVFNLIDSRSFNKKLLEEGKHFYRYENASDKLDKYKESVETLFKDFNLNDIIIIWHTDI
jgi:hypothetical protein